MPETNENNNDERIEPCDLVEAEKSEAELARENFERNICQANNVWGYSELGLQAKGAAMSAIATKTGLYARIPLICKADNCPYADSCQLLGYNLAPQGEACPVETAQIEFRFLGYAQDFNLDKASFTDKNLVSELINLDIMIERCKALIAKQEVPVVDVVAGVGENGQEYYRPEVSKYWDALDKAQRRRNEMYQLMMATRYNKKGQDNKEEGIQDILNKLKNSDFIIDQKPEGIK